MGTRHGLHEARRSASSSRLLQAATRRFPTPDVGYPWPTVRHRCLLNGGHGGGPVCSSDRSVRARFLSRRLVGGHCPSVACAPGFQYYTVALSRLQTVPWWSKSLRLALPNLRVANSMVGVVTGSRSPNNRLKLTVRGRPAPESRSRSRTAA